jgi:hypothetical protein
MKMSLHWCFNVAGLAIGTLAAVLMYYFPPRVRMYTEKGEAIVSWIGAPTEEGKRLGKWQAFLAKAAPVLLGLAFFLQLVAAFWDR